MNRDELQQTAARKMAVNAVLAIVMMVVMTWSVALPFRAAYTINTIAGMVLILAAIVGMAWPVYLGARYGTLLEN